jgi:hypothetical protein
VSYTFTDTFRVPYPTAADAVCLPAAETEWLQPAAMSMQAGEAVELASWGWGGEPHAYEAAAVGAPAWGGGQVMMFVADEIYGQLSTGSPQVLTPPPGSPSQFGAALHAADIADCRNRTSGDVQCGEELLVGAPGSMDDVGAVHWYYAWDIPADQWQYGCSYTDPSAPPLAEFGASITSPLDDETAPPNAVAGDHDLTESMIAIGAPGADEVYLAAVHANAKNPCDVLAPLQVVTAPASLVGGRFGSSVVLADFDADGIDDLAVGAPGASGGGAVVVFRGDPAGPGVLLPGLVLRGLAHLPAPQAGAEFGAALAAGFFRGDDMNRAALAIGAPGHDRSRGALCQAQFVPSGTGAPLGLGWSRCDGYAAGHPSSSIDLGSRFGAALAVADAVAMDAGGKTNSPAANLEEVVVGIPGAHVTQGGTLTREAGAVVVLEGGANGAEPRTSLSSISELFGRQTGSRFGAAVASGLVQDSPFEDLLIGVPDRGLLAPTGWGGAELTKAASQGAPLDPQNGVWTSTDSIGAPMEMMVMFDPSAGELHLAMRTRSTFATVVSGGDPTDPADLCTLTFGSLNWSGTARERIQFPPVPWSGAPGCSTITEELMPGLELEMELCWDGTHFELSIDDDGGAMGLLDAANLADCVIAGSPFLFTKTASSWCE